MLCQAQARARSSFLLVARESWIIILPMARILWIIPVAVLLAQEPRPVGKTKEDQARNAILLGGYDYSKYGPAITGYAGQDRQQIAALHWMPATRTRIGEIGNYKAGLTRLANGKLVAAVCRERPGHSDFDVLVYASEDDGLSWTRIDKTPLCGKEPSLTTLPDGSIVLTVQGGRVGCGPRGVEGANPIWRSRDGGVRWERHELRGDDYPRNLIVEKNGGLLMVRAYQRPGSGAEETGPDFELCRSQDGAVTWSCKAAKVPWDSTHGEVSAIRLRNGKLLAATRRSVPGTRDGHGFGEMMLTESSDDGRTWAKPWSMSHTGEVHAYLTELRDGRLLSSYTSYHVPFGTAAVLSRDGGKTWDLEHPVQLAFSAEAQGGWPVTIEARDGGLLTILALTNYAKQPLKFTCEIVHWRIP